MKRIFSMLMAITILMCAVGFVPINARADETFEISTAEELKAFADDVNNGDTYEGKTVTITADIALDSSEEWTPIGGNLIEVEASNGVTVMGDAYFRGTFDGGNHTISGININANREQSGFFGEVFFGVVKNLTLEGSITCTGESNIQNIGGVVGFASNYSSLYRVTSYMNIKNSVSGNIYSVGGIVGNASHNTTIKECENYGYMTMGKQAYRIGGIAGTLDCSGIIDCANKGTVSVTLPPFSSAAQDIGGIAGSLKKSQTAVPIIRNCYNSGKITGADTKYSGAIVGDTYSMGDLAAERITNNYYLDTSADAAFGTFGQPGEATSKTTEQFASGEVAYLLGDTWGQNIGTDEYPVIGGDKVYLVNGEYTNTPQEEKHTHKICGDESCTDNHDDITWTAWDNTDTLPTESGNYYLTKDVTLMSKWFPDSYEEINLCLNGHIISVDDYRLHIIGVFTFTDCSDTVHKFSVGDNGLWVLDEENGKKSVTGGILTGSHDDSNNAAIVLPPAGTVNMYNINIIGNSEFTGVDGSGENGAVYIGGGTFNMYSGRITGNVAKFCGGGVSVVTGTFNMYGGEISENVAYYGGGVDNCGGTFNMYGGKISENTSREHGGVDNVGTMTVGGASVIKDNNGGNVYVYEADSEYNISFGVNNPLADDAYIGITYGDTAPIDGNPVDITGANDVDYSKYFHSDDENYKIVNGENNVIQLVYVNKIKPYMSRMLFSCNNIQYAKVTSLNQLKELVYEQSDYDGISGKYDEAFFNDKFLYLYRIDNGSSGNVYTINSIDNTENSINIEVQQKSEGNTDDVVQWFLVLEIDKNLYDKDINVNFIKIKGENYPYEITGLELTNLAGEETEYPKENTSFIVDVDITTITERDSKDYFIVAVYDTDDALISMNYIKANLPAGSGFSCGVNIPKTDKTIGSIKAFVWDALGGMTPLAEGKAIKCSALSLME